MSALTGALLININGNKTEQFQNHNYDTKFLLTSLNVTMDGTFGKLNNISNQLPHS